MSDMGMMEKAQCDVGPSQPRVPTIRESLEWEKRRLTEQLAAVDVALGALDKAPQFEEVHNAIAKTGIQHRLR